MTVTIPPERGNYTIRVRSWRFAVAAIVIAVALPATIGAARRNLAYLRLLHGNGSGGNYAGDDLYVLRRSLQRGDWPTAGRMLAKTSGPDRLAALLVIHEAGRRVTARDVDGARAALAIVTANAGSDPALWYRAGEIYERAGALRDAVAAYTRGAAVDPTAPWTEGRYRIAMIYQHEKNWQGLVDLLAPVLMTASDEELVRNIETLRAGGAVWQGTFLALGEAFDKLGRTAEAEAVYERVSRIAAPRRDWTLNRALVYLSAAKRSRLRQGYGGQARLRQGDSRQAHGDLAAALEAVRRALDLATEFDDSFRREYELDTAGEASRLIDQARRDGGSAALNTSLDELVRRSPESPGAWFLRGLASEAACDPVAARSHYDRAATLVRPGSGAFLKGRPLEPAKGACPPR